MPSASPTTAQELSVRLMAANTSSGPLQSYPHPGPGTRIFQALDPDVVLIQEFNVNATRNGANDGSAVDRWVDEVFGLDYHWFREPGGDSIPNGVISRFPILEAGEWRDPEVSNRDFAYARLDLPGERELWVVSVHLLTRSSGARNAEARALVRAIREHPVPDDDFLVVGGDLNTDRRSESALSTLAQVVDVLGPFPHDGDAPPDGDTNRSRRKPYDWLLAEADLEVLAVPTVVGELIFPEGLVFDSRVFAPEELIESFSPVLPGDSDAPQMQHMAVVRDFRIPLGNMERDFTLTPTRVDFGSVVQGNSRVLESVTISISSPFSITAVSLVGERSEELALEDPDLSQGPVLVDGDRALRFRWTPEQGPAGDLAATATLITDGDPGAVEIEIVGRVRTAGSGARLDLSGYRLEQSGGPATLVIPPGTLLEPGGVLVVGRAATRSEFEAFWGSLGEPAVYLNASDLVGEPGFPVINGGERYRLLDRDGAAVDPGTGQIPAAATRRGRVYLRESTLEPRFIELRVPLDQATPGRYQGELGGTGRAVVTEISDAPGPGGFAFEFIEIVWDAPEL